MKSIESNKREIRDNILLKAEDLKLNPSWIKQLKIEHSSDTADIQIVVDGLMHNCYQVIPSGSKINLLAGIFKYEAETPKFVSVNTSIDIGSSIDSIVYCEEKGNGLIEMKVNKIH